ncbi:elongation of very long chain fatty acids protein 4-like [Argiope bruennichi]|nr:elongation of very long chain fatty acids protein 4-like [Argiope bruennichi]
MLIDRIYDFIWLNPIGIYLNENEYQCYCILVVYLLFVMWLGPFWMRTRKPFDLKIPMIVYNLFTSAFNLILVYQLYKTLSGNWDVRCQRGTPEYLQRVQSEKYIQWNIIFEKYFSLLDTIFFVLRKKQNQVSFLHVFHHVATACITLWFVTIPDPAFFILITILLNTLVHVIMYFYYGLSAFGESIKKYLWWKRYLTLIQIVQFLLVLSYMTISFGTGCEKVKTLEVVYSAFVITMLVLFINFYQKSFKRMKLE